MSLIKKVNKTPRKRGIPPHKPTVKNKNKVKKHVMVGTPQELIADIIGIDAKTLRKYYREELDQALAIANSEVGGVLYRKAMKGDPASVIWWEKTRSGKREAREGDDNDGKPPNVTVNIVNPHVNN
jgi:hypothetical protein